MFFYLKSLVRISVWALTIKLITQLGGLFDSVARLTDLLWGCSTTVSDEFIEQRVIPLLGIGHQFENKIRTNEDQFAHSYCPFDKATPPQPLSRRASWPGSPDLEPQIDLDRLPPTRLSNRSSGIRSVPSARQPPRGRSVHLPPNGSPSPGFPKPDRGRYHRRRLP